MYKLDINEIINDGKHGDLYCNTSYPHKRFPKFKINLNDEDDKDSNFHWFINSPFLSKDLIKLKNDHHLEQICHTTVTKVAICDNLIEMM
jgi:hypothetical protein